MSEECFDVVLQSNGEFGYSPKHWESDPPPDDNFYLSSDFWIGGLPYDTSPGVIFDACAPAGFKFHPSRTYECRYAFCRKVVPPLERYYFTWDHDGHIGRTLFLSRLIHPTTIAPKHSARLFYKDSELTTIVPGRVRGFATHVWLVAKQWRDWLSQVEAEQLRALSGDYILQPPERVRRARVFIDHAFHTPYLDQATASIAASFESLLKVDKIRTTAQFKLRVPALAGMVGYTISPDEAEIFYDDRSIFVHGSEPNSAGLSAEVLERYQKFETVLRRALSRASTETAFADLFADDGAVLRTFGRL